MKNITLLFLMLCIGGSLLGQNIASKPLTKAMAQTFVVAIQADSSYPSDQIIIIKDKVCSEQDCLAIFEGLPVTIYAREDLFMRNLNSYYRIGAVSDLAGGEQWQLKFIYLIKHGEASIPGTITGSY